MSNQFPLNEYTEYLDPKIVDELRAGKTRFSLHVVFHPPIAPGLYSWLRVDYFWFKIECGLPETWTGKGWDGHDFAMRGDNVTLKQLDKICQQAKCGKSVAYIWKKI
jgi:hypothetical protein